MSDLVSYRIAWPRQVSDEQLLSSLRVLATSAGTPTVLEAVGVAGRIIHRMRIPESRANQLVRQLRTAMPGLVLERIEGQPSSARMAVSVRLSTRHRPLSSDRLADTSAAVLTSLAGAGREESIVLQWLLTDRLLPATVPSTAFPQPSDSLVRSLLSAPFGSPPPSDADSRSALRHKRGEPGWRVVGRIAVQAASDGRARQLMSGVLAALRTAEAPGVRVSGRSTPTRHMVRTSGHGRIRLNVRELAAVCAWPVGDTADLPVASQRSRRVPASRDVSRDGRVLGLSTWPGPKRPLALTPTDSLRHLHLLGPTGTGKSTLLLNLITQDVDAGRPVVVVDPTGDLIADLLARIPTARRDDVVVLDPTAEPVVGCNPLAGEPASADLRADQLLNVLHGLYQANWGPRTSDILGAALLTLARIPGMSLPAVPLLLTNPGFRRRVLAGSSDPLGVDSFWASYEAWSDAERTAAIAPALNKLRPFLVRPAMRRIVGQPSPGFDIGSVFEGKRILLVNLATGQIGAEGANLLGALVLARIWQAAQARSAVPAGDRHPVNVYLDEFADYLALPINLADALAQARGRGVGFTLAHQHLGQLSPSMKAAVLANARSRVCFQLSADDARVIAQTSTLLGSDDFVSLDRFEFYAQLVADSAVQPWCSGRSQAATKPSNDPDVIRRRSVERYGLPAKRVDAELQELFTASTATPSDIGPRPRRGGRS